MGKKRILLIGGNFYPESIGIGKYNSEMIDWLSTQGHQCTVITTYPYYPFWKIQAPYKKASFWYKDEQRILKNAVPVNVYRCPHYIPEIPGGKKRVLSDLSFFISAFFRLVALMFQKKYDYVITVAPPFQLGLLGLLYKIVRGAKFIYHIQDLQIDAAHELGMIKFKLLVRVLFRHERFILEKADHVSSISEGMIRKIKAKFERRVILFLNWVDTRDLFPILQKDECRKEFNFLPGDKIILYSGAIGEKQGIDNVLYSARELSARSDIKFIICGSGPYRDKLIDLAKEMKLQNVIFMHLQPKEKFNRFLNIADVHLILQKANTNDLVMPSKLTPILSVGGLALVAADPETSLHYIIKTNNIGILIEPDNKADLTASILSAIQHPHTAIRNNAREFADGHLGIDKVISKYFMEIMAEPASEPVKISAKEKVQLDTVLNLEYALRKLKSK